MTTEKPKKNEKKYYCEYCDLYTSKKTDYKRHLETTKHKNNVSTTNDNQKTEKKHICDICEKEYNDRAGLWRHKKKCNENKIVIEKEISDKDLIMMLLHLFSFKMPNLLCHLINVNNFL